MDTTAAVSGASGKKGRGGDEAKADVFSGETQHLKSIDSLL